MKKKKSTKKRISDAELKRIAPGTKKSKALSLEDMARRLRII